MPLTPEQTTALASWIAAGDNLSTVQKKLADQFHLTLTYKDVRFLIDDLNLTLKDPPPSPPPSPAATAAQADLTRPAPRASGQPPRASTAFDADDLEDPNIPPHAQHPPPLRAQQPAPREDELYDEDDSLPPQIPENADADASGDDDTGTNGASTLRVEVDNVTLIPGALASGTVTFTDGVTGKWVVDQYGRPGFTQISRQNYRPTQADAQAFMQELGLALHKKGLM